MSKTSKKVASYRMNLGRRYSQLVIVGKVIDPNSDSKHSMIEVRCDCGVKRFARCSSLRDGGLKSCGQCPRKLEALKDRFDRYVDLDGPIPKHAPELGKCEIWTGSTNYGYGMMNRFGKTAKAHHLAWEFVNGPPPTEKGLCVLHRCDNRACVRVSHLFLGTRKENNEDRSRKGRNGHSPGTSNGRAKLSNEDIKKIRFRIRTLMNAEFRAIAKAYKVSDTLIRFISGRKIWNHVH